MVRNDYHPCSSREIIIDDTIDDLVVDLIPLVAEKYRYYNRMLDRQLPHQDTSKAMDYIFGTAMDEVQNAVRRSISDEKFQRMKEGFLP